MDASCLDQCLLDAKEKPASSVGTLRQRGGGAVAHRVGFPVILATSKDTVMHQGEPTEESPVWSTPITKPPPRLKRSRKSEADDTCDATSNSNNLLDTAAPHADALDNSSHRIQVSFMPSAVTSAAEKVSSSSPSRRSSSSRRSISRPAGVAPVPELVKTEWTPEETPEEDVAMSPHNPPPIGVLPTESFSPEVATFGVSALAPVDAAPAAAEASALVVSGASPGESKKARHNLTERRRITRMNELFDQLSAAIEEPDETPLLLGNLALEPSAADVDEPPTAEDPDDPTARPKERSGASKANVLEAALRCIRDLRAKLAEERFARPFLSIADLDDMASMCTVADTTNGGLDSTMEATEPQEVSDYKDVAW